MYSTCGSHGSRQWETRVEEEPIAGESDREDWMLEQTIKFLRGAFDNLKARKALAREAHPTDQPTPATASNGAITSDAAMAAEAGPTTVAAAPAPPPAAQSALAVGAVPVQLRRHRIQTMGVKFNGDPKQLGFFLAHVWTCMQEYGPEIATKWAKVQCVSF